MVEAYPVGPGGDVLEGQARELAVGAYPIVPAREGAVDVVGLAAVAVEDHALDPALGQEAAAGQGEDAPAQVVPRALHGGDIGVGLELVRAEEERGDAADVARPVDGRDGEDIVAVVDIGGRVGGRASPDHGRGKAAGRGSDELALVGAEPGQGGGGARGDRALEGAGVGQVPGIARQVVVLGRDPADHEAVRGEEPAFVEVGR